MFVALLCFELGAVLMLAPAATGNGYDWPQFNFDAQHSGNNSRETELGARNVAGLRRLYQANLPATADSAPVYLSGVRTRDGIKNFLFVTTKAGHIIALDSKNGHEVWRKQYPPGNCRINNGSEPCLTTSSPAIDPDRGCVYSYGLDGRVHKLKVGDGEEIKQDGWPELATLKPFNEKGSSALAVATDRSARSYLYVANGGYLGDRGDYQGHITAIDLSNGSQKVFNANCSNQTVHFAQKPQTPDCPAVRSAIWARAGVVYDAGTNRIFMATGNGPFDPHRHDWGDSVLALAPDGEGSNGGPIDSFTPEDQQMLQDYDLDLGSTAPAIIPTPPKSKVRHLAVQGGKNQKLHLIDLANLSGRVGPGHVGGGIGKPMDVPQGGMIFTAPAVWTDPSNRQAWVFLATGRGVSGLTLELDPQGTPYLKAQWKTSEGATSPIIANGVLYCAGSHDIRALDPRSGKRLWTSRKIGRIHWESPIVADGVLYITDEDARITAFGLGNHP